MNIGFDAKRAFFNRSGLGNYSRFFLEVLGKYHPENNYFLYSPKPAQDTIIDTTGFEVRLPSANAQKLKLGGYWRSFSIDECITKDKLDIFHGLSNEIPFLKNQKTKYIVSIHDLLFIRYPELYAFIDRQIYKKKFKYACKNADAIIAVSEQTKNDIVDFFGIQPEKITVIYQGCQPAFKEKYLSSELLAVKKKYSLPDRFMLNVGTIEPRKNALNIVRAMEILQDKIDIPLVIIGKATAYKKKIVEYAKAKGLLNRVIFLHNVGFTDLPKVYQLAGLFVYPSIFEGFGIPIIEAIFSGVPVISSKGSCFSEAGGPHSLYADSNEPKELADFIQRVLENEDLSKSMVEKGLGYVKRFEDGQLALDMHNFYQNVAGK